MYTVYFTKQAADELRELSEKLQKQIGRKIDLLAQEPKRANVKKLEGYPDLYRFRSGDYRIIYQVRDQEVLIIVIRIGHRREIYKKLS
jgi:mRNA interferase RelE/StbE